MPSEQLLLLPLWYAVFLLAATFHEAAHAFAARQGGDPTAYLGGQVSLNPLPHVLREPVGTVVVPLLSFLLMGWMMGWASAPYDPAWEERHPRRAAAMAAAGPLANLFLMLLAFAILKAGIAGGIWEPGQHWPLDRIVAPATAAAGWADGLGRLLSVMLALNLVLFLFNLIPLPPMDGAAVLAGLAPPFREALRFLRGMPLAGLIGIVIAWRLFPRIFGPLYGVLLGWLWG